LLLSLPHHAFLIQLLSYPIAVLFDFSSILALCVLVLAKPRARLFLAHDFCFIKHARHLASECRIQQHWRWEQMQAIVFRRDFLSIMLATFEYCNDSCYIAALYATRAVNLGACIGKIAPGT
jgi:hypothetical protein